MSEKISSHPAAIEKIRLLHRGRNITKANIYECLYQDQRAILKDYKNQNSLIRFTIGRWLAAREYRMYRMLQGIPGVSKVIEKPDHYSFILGYLEGKPLPEMPRELIHPSTFDSLRKTLIKIHERGVACGDIHHRDVLITKSGETFLIDFATGWQKGSKLNLLNNFVFKKLLALDWLAFYRMRERYTGTSPSLEEKREYNDILFFYAIGRFLKGIYHFIKHKN